MALALLPSVSHYRRLLVRGRLRRLRSGGIHVWFIVGFGTACIIRLAPEKETLFEQKLRGKCERCLASQAWHSRPKLGPFPARQSRRSSPASDSDG